MKYAVYAVSVLFTQFTILVTEIHYHGPSLLHVSVHTNRGCEVPLILMKVLINEAKQDIVDVGRCVFVFVLWEQ